MTIDRRALLAAGAGLVAAPAVGRTVATWPPAERIALWPGEPPGGVAEPSHPFRGAAVPELGVYRAPRPDGRAVLVIPGGGYASLSLDGEGAAVAEALNRFGVTAFVLAYRLPIDGWRDRAEAPLQDAQRAIRMIRHHAARHRLDPGRVSAIGFSAGGHLAGSLATMTPAYPPHDAADRLSARPATAALLYAVSNMSAGRSRGGSRANLLGPSPDPALVRRFAVDAHLAGAPPLFLAAAEDDETVPIVNTLDLAAAARRARAPAETHVFARGGHGFGAHPPHASPAALWPDLYDRWLLETLSRTAG